MSSRGFGIGGHKPYAGHQESCVTSLLLALGALLNALGVIWM